MIRVIKNLRSSDRFSFFCFLFIVIACVFSVIINLTLGYVEGTRDSILTSVNTVVAIPAAFVYMLLFILPGFLVTVQLIEKELIKRKYLLLVSVTLSAILAYLVFWIYIIDHITGKTISTIIILACVILFFFRLKSLKEYIFDPLFVKPLTICFITGCLYSGILLLYSNISGEISAIVNNRFITGLPSDNIIPRWVLDMAYNGRPLYMLSDGYWYVTERPPVMVAIKLLVFPLNIIRGNVSAFHQFFGTYIQLLWIPALYYLCDFFSLSDRVRKITITCAIFSGVFLINSVFVWPKLLTTVFFCLVFLLTFELVEEKKNTLKAAVCAVMIGIATAMSILSHGGVMFSFFALGLAIIISKKRSKYNYRDILYAFGTFGIIYLPWHLLSKYYNPWGNRLLKVIFAGNEIDHPSLLQSIFMYYTQTPIETIYYGKTANFLDMFDFNIWNYTNLENIRLYSFNKVFGGAAILNIFLVVAIVYFLVNYCFNKKKLNHNQKILLGFTFFSFTLWPLMMSNGAILFQGSYFNPVLLYILFAFGIKHSKKYITIPVYVANILIFISAYVIHRGTTIGQSFSGMNYSMLVMMLLSAAALFTYLYVFDKEKDSI